MSILSGLSGAVEIHDAAIEHAGIAGRKAAEVIFNKLCMWGRDEEREDHLFDRAGEAFEAVFTARGYQPDMVETLSHLAMETCIAHFDQLKLEAEIAEKL